MTCPFCSLLCDAPAILEECPLRLRLLHDVQSRSAARQATDIAETSLTCDYEAKRNQANKWISEASSIMLTGRISSVESARAVIDFARKHDATIDFSDQGATMDMALATSRIGGVTVSLAEARDLSDVVFILGDDSLSELFPNLPIILSKPGRKPVVVLHGQHSDRNEARWRDQFDEVWRIDCPVRRIPTALDSFFSLHYMQSYEDTISQQFPPTSPLLKRLHAANYISLIWSPRSLDPATRSLWIERLLEHQTKWNKTRRVGSLGLAGQDSVFQNVCLWTTGYPGRVSFQADSVEYDPIVNNVSRWIAEHRQAPNALLIELDETAHKDNDWQSSLTKSFQGRRIVAVPRSRDNLPDNAPEALRNSLHFEIQIAGVDRPADMLRADQVVMARVAPMWESFPEKSPAISQWLEEVGR
jgi:formylmethanofuran dehydrogenase subunit B